MISDERMVNRRMEESVSLYQFLPSHLTYHQQIPHPIHSANKIVSFRTGGCVFRLHVEIYILAVVDRKSHLA